MDRDYALFAAIVQEGSLSAAARRLKLSVAMVSKRLARLEMRLGATLIHRSTRRSVLTDVGARFYEDVVAVLTAAAAAEARASGVLGRPSGPLRVSAPTALGRLHIAPRLGEFLERHPDVRLELNLTDTVEDLLASRTDLAVRITSAVPPELLSRRLAGSRRVLCVSPAYRDRRGAPNSLEALRRHDLLAARGQLPWRLTHANGAAAVVDGSSRVETNSSELIKDLAVAGLGVALRSLWEIEDDLRAGALERILPEYEGSADLAVFAVTLRRQVASPAVEALTQHLATVFGASPIWTEARSE